MSCAPNNRLAQSRAKELIYPSAISMARRPRIGLSTCQIKNRDIADREENENENGERYETRYQRPSPDANLSRPSPHASVMSLAVIASTAMGAQGRRALEAEASTPAEARPIGRDQPLEVHAERRPVRVFSRKKTTFLLLLRVRARLSLFRRRTTTYGMGEEGGSAGEAVPLLSTRGCGAHKRLPPMGF